MDEIQTIVNKMTKIEESLNKLHIAMATHTQQEKNHQNNIERFWNSTWPEMQQQVENNRLKIMEIEIAITRINTKITFFGVILTFVVPTITGFLIKLFFHHQ